MGVSPGGGFQTGIAAREWRVALCPDGATPGVSETPRYRPSPSGASRTGCSGNRCPRRTSPYEGPWNA